MVTGTRILVVDDSEHSRLVLADVLKAQGHTVHTASDGKWAWLLLCRAWFSYDLVVTDLVMPEMNGIELLSRIRADCPWIKVVLITAHIDPEVRSRALMLGAFAVLSKPCDVEQLKGMVELALAK